VVETLLPPDVVDVMCLQVEPCDDSSGNDERVILSNSGVDGVKQVSNLVSDGFVIIRLEPMLLGEYWNYFRAQFGRFHAIAYNSAESEPIWMKSEAI